MNQISDISPLVDLAYMLFLELSGDQISDISPLANFHLITSEVLKKLIMKVALRKLRQMPYEA